MKRQSRTVRRPRVNVTLSDRDQTVLCALARFGIARTGDLLTLAFSQVRPDTANRRLRRLFDSSYLEVELQHRAGENLYRLGPAGRAWAAGQGLSVFRQPRVSLNHHLAVVRAWVGLARVCHDLSGLELLRVVPEWELRTLPEAGAYPVIPDALVELRMAGGPGDSVVRIVLEVDLATEGLTVLRRKVTQYGRLLATEEGLWGWTDFVLGFAVSGWKEDRLKRFTEHLDTFWLGSWTIWDVAAGPEMALRRLLQGPETPLTTSPYGKGSLSLVSS